MPTTTENSTLNEKLITNELSSGLKCYIIPKKEFVVKQAMICTKYGSLDNTFSTDGNKHSMPEGIAHFLEHKMFEQENGGNVFESFINQGADCNAYTNYTQTAYYFSCTDKFEENLKLLLSFIRNPYFTEDNVQKEKGIISQEIAMYDDDPNWIVYVNLFKALYNTNPVRENIAGTADSIMKITKDMLYDCYNTFYNPHNMGLIICGDVDENEIFDIAETTVKKRPSPEIERIYGEEPNQVSQKYIEQKMDVSIPAFNIGFKENDFSMEPNKKNAATKTLIDIMAGQSSQLYERLYNKGLINNEFDASYMGSPYFGTSIFGGYSKDPDKVLNMLLDEISRLKAEGIPDELFSRTKKKHIGRFIKGFNSIEATAYAQADYFTRDTDILKSFDAYYNLEKSDLIKRLDEHFCSDFSAMSVVSSKR